MHSFPEFQIINDFPPLYYAAQCVAAERQSHPAHYSTSTVLQPPSWWLHQHGSSLHQSLFIQACYSNVGKTLTAQLYTSFLLSTRWTEEFQAWAEKNCIDKKLWSGLKKLITFPLQQTQSRYCFMCFICIWYKYVHKIHATFSTICFACQTFWFALTCNSTAPRPHAGSTGFV